MNKNKIVSILLLVLILFLALGIGLFFSYKSILDIHNEPKQNIKETYLTIKNYSDKQNEIDDSVIAQQLKTIYLYLRIMFEFNKSDPTSFNAYYINNLYYHLSKNNMIGNINNIDNIINTPIFKPSAKPSVNPSHKPSATPSDNRYSNNDTTKINLNEIIVQNIFNKDNCFFYYTMQSNVITCNYAIQNGDDFIEYIRNLYYSLTPHSTTNLNNNSIVTEYYDFDNNTNKTSFVEKLEIMYTCTFVPVALYNMYILDYNTFIVNYSSAFYSYSDYITFTQMYDTCKQMNIPLIDITEQNGTTLKSVELQNNNLYYSDAFINKIMYIFNNSGYVNSLEPSYILFYNCLLYFVKLYNIPLNTNYSIGPQPTLVPTTLVPTTLKPTTLQPTTLKPTTLQPKLIESAKNNANQNAEKAAQTRANQHAVFLANQEVLRLAKENANSNAVKAADKAAKTAANTAANTAAKTAANTAAKTAADIYANTGVTGIIEANDPRYTVSDASGVSLGAGNYTQNDISGTQSVNVSNSSGVGISNHTLSETSTYYDVSYGNTGILNGRVPGSATDMGVTREEWSTITYNKSGSGTSDNAPKTDNTGTGSSSRQFTDTSGVATNDRQETAPPNYFSDAPIGVWSGITTSRNGDSSGRIAACADDKYIYTSDNDGMNWIERTNSKKCYWTSITSSNDGMIIAACASDEHIYRSNNHGIDWIVQKNSGQYKWSSITSSGTGQKLAACVYNGGIYISTNYGESWTKQLNVPDSEWTSITSSENGNILLACIRNGGIYMSINAGLSWTLQSKSPILTVFNIMSSIASTRYANTIVTSVYQGGIYKLSNSGSDWNSIIPASQLFNWNLITKASQSFDWNSIAISGYGSVLAGCTTSYGIYISLDSGQTWTQPSYLSFTKYHKWISITLSDTYYGILLCAGSHGNSIYSKIIA